MNGDLSCLPEAPRPVGNQGQVTEFPSTGLPQT